MLITLLKQKGKSEEFYLELDNQAKGLVQFETIYKHHLKEGKDISLDEYLICKEESDRLSCFSKALAYISGRLKTEKQMLEYLLGKGYMKNIALEAIAKLKEYGYINDEYYARTFAELSSSTKGKRYVKQQLFSKGVNVEIIDEVVNELDNDENACNVVITKWLKGKELPLDKKNKEKLYRFLLGRGFEYDTIKHCVNDILNEDL